MSIVRGHENCKAITYGDVYERGLDRKIMTQESSQPIHLSVHERSDQNVISSNLMDV